MTTGPDKHGVQPDGTLNLAGGQKVLEVDIGLEGGASCGASAASQTSTDADNAFVGLSRCNRSIIQAKPRTILQESATAPRPVRVELRRVVL